MLHHKNNYTPQLNLHYPYNNYKYKLDGYADTVPAGKGNYGIISDFEYYTSGYLAGGNNIDISWAVDSNTLQNVNLISVKWIKIVSSMINTRDYNNQIPPVQNELSYDTDIRGIARIKK